MKTGNSQIFPRLKFQFRRHLMNFELRGSSVDYNFKKLSNLGEI